MPTMSKLAVAHKVVKKDKTVKDKAEQQGADSYETVADKQLHAETRHQEEIRLFSKERSQRATRRALRTTVRSILCCPIRFACCWCTSIHGVLELMRSDTTREFALAVVVGTAFEVFIASVARDVITPCIFALPLFANPAHWVFGFTDGLTGFVLVGGEQYQQPNVTIDPFSVYPSNRAAELDNARYINITSFLEGSLAFVLTLLNIYWFFGCVTKTEKAEKFFRGFYDEASDVAKLAGEKAAGAAGIDVAAMEKKRERMLKMLQTTQNEEEEEVEEEGAEGTLEAAPVRRGCSVPLADVRSDDEVCPCATTRTRPSVLRRSVGTSASAAVSQLPTTESAAGVEPSAVWLPLVNTAKSVQDGMRQLHDLAPLTFYLHGEAVRRALEYKFEHLMADPSAVAAELPNPGQRTSTDPYDRGYESRRVIRRIRKVRRSPPHAEQTASLRSTSDDQHVDDVCLAT